MENQQTNQSMTSEFMAPPVLNQEAQAPVLKTKDWMIILLITMIPLINIVMLFVWAFSQGENPNKSNWAKANLLWMAIGVGLAIIIMIMFASLIF